MSQAVEHIELEALLPLLAEPEDFLIEVEDEAVVQALIDAAPVLGPNVGVVGDRIPLLENLDWFENACLPLIYHRNLTWRAAAKRLAPAVKALGLEPAVGRPKAFLTDVERFKAMLLRVYAAECDVLLVLEKGPEHHPMCAKARSSLNWPVRFRHVVSPATSRAYEGFGLPKRIVL